MSNDKEPFLWNLGGSWEGQSVSLGLQQAWVNITLGPKSLLFLLLWGNRDVQCHKFSKFLKNSPCETLEVNAKALCLVCWTMVGQKGKATHRIQAQEPGWVSPQQSWVLHHPVLREQGCYTQGKLVLRRDTFVELQSLVTILFDGEPKHIPKPHSPLYDIFLYLKLTIPPSS